MSSEEAVVNKDSYNFSGDYTTSGTGRPYLVLYLLHGDARNTTGNASVTTVMPNGDTFEFYINSMIMVIDNRYEIVKLKCFSRSNTSTENTEKFLDRPFRSNKADKELGENLAMLHFLWLEVERDIINVHKGK